MSDDQWTTCPCCGVRNNAHDAPDPAARPVDGDVSVCFSCREPMFFTLSAGRLGLRRPSERERAELLADPRIQRARAAIAESYTGDEAVALTRGGE